MKKIIQKQHSLDKQTVVVKIGGALNVTDGKINKKFVDSMCHQLAKLVYDYNLIITISGAIPLGLGRSSAAIELVSREKKALYSMRGQPKLVMAYVSALEKNCIASGQGLYTTEDLRKSFTCKVLGEAFSSNVIVLANENDAVDPEEIIGDNDFLAAKLAVLTKADFLIILSSLSGITSGDNIIDRINTDEITDEFIQSIDNHSTSRPGSNGIGPKLKATKMACDNGIKNVIIANGNEPQILTNILYGEKIGTQITK